MVTIAVTAAVTTVMIGLLNWAFSIFNAIIPISSTSEKVKKIFSTSTSRWILFDSIWLLFNSWNLYSFTRETTPVTHATIIRGCILLGGVLVMLVDLGIRLGKLFMERQMAKLKATYPEPR